jgi:hypothetical protein
MTVVPPFALLLPSLDRLPHTSGINVNRISTYNFNLRFDISSDWNISDRRVRRESPNGESDFGISSFCIFITISRESHSFLSYLFILYSKSKYIN